MTELADDVSTSDEVAVTVDTLSVLDDSRNDDATEVSALLTLREVEVHGTLGGCVHCLDDL